MSLTKVYVASPYTYKGKYKFLGGLVRWKRFFQVMYYQAFLDSYYPVQCFGPILESHMVVALAKLCNLPIGKSSGKWADFRDGDLAMVEAMDELWVIMMDGWDFSTGVRAEMRRAKMIGKPIKYFDTKELVLRETPKGAAVSMETKERATA